MHDIRKCLYINKKDRLRWFRHAANCIKRCMTMYTDGSRKKQGLSDEDMVGLCQGRHEQLGSVPKNAEFRNKWKIDIATS